MGLVRRSAAVNHPKIVNRLWAAPCALLMAAALPAQASMISYVLDQSNLDNDVFVDGMDFARLTIDDHTANTLTFSLSLLTPLTSQAVANFGIQGFSFNVQGLNPLTDSPSAPWLLPSGWSAKVAPPNNQYDGFGRFDVSVETTGSGRLDPLVFQIVGTGLTLADFVEASTGNAVQGNTLFAAHITGFNDGFRDASGYFGGSRLSEVPLPAPALLLLGGLLAAVPAWRRRAAR
jgi:hypothetical protein